MKKKRVSTIKGRKMRGFIAAAQSGKRPAARAVRRMFLRSVEGNVTCSAGLRKWAAQKTATEQAAKAMRKQNAEV